MVAPFAPRSCRVRTFKQEIIFILARHPSRRIDKYHRRKELIQEEYNAGEMERAMGRRVCGKKEKRNGVRGWCRRVNQLLATFVSAERVLSRPTCTIYEMSSNARLEQIDYKMKLMIPDALESTQEAGCACVYVPPWQCSSIPT